MWIVHNWASLKCEAVGGENEGDEASRDPMVTLQGD